MKEARTEIIHEPGTNKLITITNDVLRLVSPTRGMFGRVRFIDQERTELDLSELIEVDTIPEFPVHMEVITKDCNMNLPVIPCRFHHEGTEYREVWFYASSLEWVAGPNGQHLKPD